MSARPFRILGLQQVAIGGPRRDVLEALWVELLGVQPCGQYTSASENVDESILRVGVAPHEVEIDLMQPVDPEARPRVHQPPLNHLGLWVDDLAAAVGWLETQGVRFTPGGIRKGAAGHDVCFIHPKGNDAAPRGGEGVLIELVQAPAEVGQTAGCGHEPGFPVSEHRRQAREYGGDPGFQGLDEAAGREAAHGRHGVAAFQQRVASPDLFGH